MPYKSKIQAVAVKLEVAEGTDAVPTADDALPTVGAPQFTPAPLFENRNEDAHFGGLGRWSEDPPAGEYGDLEFSFRVRGKATAAALGADGAEADAIYQATGAAVTLVASAGSEEAEYQWGLNTGEKSASAYWWQDGLLNRLIGARGTIGFQFDAGRPIVATARLRGIRSEIDSAFPSLSLSDDPKPPLVKGSAFTLGGWSAVWSRMGVDINAQVSDRPGPDPADAILPPLITDYDPTMGLDPEVVALATFDPRAKWKSKDGLAMSFGPVGSAAGNRVAAAAAKTQLRAPGFGERNMYRTYDLTCGLKVSSGQDFFTLTFN